MISEIFRWTPRQFTKAAAAGWFEGSKAELLGGVVYKMTTNPPHMVVLHRLVSTLESLAAEPAWVVTKEDTVALGSWLPLPDSTVVRGPLELYSQRLPTAEDILLIVEVSDTTYAKDRGRKYRRYAASKIPYFWIVDLNRRRIEVHSSPDGQAYRNVEFFEENDDVPVILSGHCVGHIAVRDILP
jgi:Uma2 family endonuclease